MRPYSIALFVLLSSVVTVPLMAGKDDPISPVYGSIFELEKMLEQVGKEISVLNEKNKDYALRYAESVSSKGNSSKQAVSSAEIMDEWKALGLVMSGKLNSKKKLELQKQKISSSSSGVFSDSPVGDESSPKKAFSPKLKRVNAIKKRDYLRK